MSKRNTFLDAGDEEEDDVVVSDSDDNQDSRFSRLNAKRQKLNLSEDEELSQADTEEYEEALSEPKFDDATIQDYAENITNEQESQDEAEKERKRVLNKVKIEKAQRKVRKTGVIYISRVPPFMKPSTLRQFLAPYGTILRIFLTPEPAPRYQARVRAGGNKKKSFVDGWVEFESKKKAKICAEALNGNIIGGKKGGFYHDDIWNIKYLKGFKWNDLMEQVQGEEREREGRLQAEIEKERRERKLFMRNAERAKVERGMSEKRRRKTNTREATEPNEGDGDNTNSSVEDVNRISTQRRAKMIFKQHFVRHGGQVDSAEGAVAPRTLSKIF